MTSDVLKISQVTDLVREAIESSGRLADVWVEGEISRAFPSRSGYVYVGLKDADGLLEMVIRPADARRMRRMPQPGEQVAVHGHVSTYAPKSQYQLVVDMIQPAGQGLQALQLAQLRQRLTDEGLFDAGRKRPLPVAPKCIGVATSASGAVWHDIQNVIRRRYPLTELVLSPCAVQGEHAAPSIVAAIQALQHDPAVEVIIVARGGGSSEDLYCFNDERVVRAVFASRLPVVSAVGHETDWTLVDEVSDLRAPTPSAAAELCTPSVEEMLDQIRAMEASVRFSMHQRIAGIQRMLDQAARRQEGSSPAGTVAGHRRDVQTLRNLIDARWDVRARGARQAIRLRSTHRTHLMQTLWALVSSRTANRVTALEAMNPEAVLQRGYAIVSRGPGDPPVMKSTDVAKGDDLVAWLASGMLSLTVSEAIDVRLSRPQRSQETHG